MKIFAAALAAITLSACAFTEEAVDVRYIAPANISVVEGAQDVLISVRAMDGRVANKDRVSSKKNGYGMETAKITAANDINQEIGNAVQAELASLGFQIGGGGIEVVTETQTFYNDFKTGLWHGEAVAEVGFQLTAKKPDGTLVYSRPYKAIGIVPEIMMASGENAQKALSLALLDAVQKVVRDGDLHQALLQAGRPAPTPKGKPIS